MKNQKKFNPHNVNTWNGRWYCPFCKAPVGSPECSCGTSWMLVKEDAETEIKLLVFFEAGTMQPLKGVANGGPLLYAGVVKKIFFVSKEGEILGKAAKRDVFKANLISRTATDSF